MRRRKQAMLACGMLACAVAWTGLAEDARAQQSSQQNQQEGSDQEDRDFDSRSQFNQQSSQQRDSQRRMQSGTQDDRRLDQDRRFQDDQRDRSSSLQRDGRDQYRQDDRIHSQRDMDRMRRDDQRGSGPQAGLGVSVVDGNRGVQVQRVAPDSPADEAGIRTGDEILAVNGREIRDGQQLVDVIQEEDPGSGVDIELMRNGRVQQVSANLERRGEVFSEQQMQQRRGYRSDYLDSPPWDDDELRRHIESLEQTVDQMQREIRDLRTMLDNDPSGSSYSSSPSQPNRRAGASTTRGYSTEYQQTDSRQLDQRSSREFDSNRNFDSNRGTSSDRTRQDEGNRSQRDDQDRSQRDQDNRDRNNR